MAGAEGKGQGLVDRPNVGDVEAGFEVRATGGLVGAAAFEQFAAEHRERLDRGEQAEDAVGELRIAAGEAALADDVDHAADGVGGHVGRGDFRDFDAIHVGDVGGGEARAAAGGAVGRGTSRSSPTTH